jgi:beta-phosphoglucomutase
MIRAAMFDLDGILVDATALHFDALNLALNEAGTIILPDERQMFEGLPTRDKLVRLVDMGRLEHSSAQQVYRRKQELTQEITDATIGPDPDKVEMCIALSKRMPLVCVSNCIRASVDMLLGRSCILQFFAHTVSNEDVVRAKPAPEPYLKALGLLNMKASEVIAFEDHPRGVESATAAGIKCIKLDYEHVHLTAITAVMEEQCRS